MCQDGDLTDKATAWDAVIAARMDERERCAKIAESFKERIYVRQSDMAVTIAAAIRQMRPLR